VESFRRVANDPVSPQRADMVATINSRQVSMNRYMTEGSFEGAPQFQPHFVPLNNPNDLLNRTPDGISAFYGPSNSASTGRTHVPIFDVPQAPLLSLAAFANADLTGTAYAP